VIEEKFCNLSDMSADGVRRLVVSEDESQELFEELSLLWARGSELCFAIVGPLQVRNFLLEGMWAAALRHTEVVRELDVLQTAVSSTVELVLGRSPNETFRVEDTDELVAKFWTLEELCSWILCPGMRIYDLLLGPPLG
jgi:hypothetical protein